MDNKSFAVPKPVRPTSKRTTVDNKPSTSKKLISKDVSRKSVVPCNFGANNNSEATVLDESIIEHEGIADRKAAANEFEAYFRHMFSECLVEEKIKREETQVDVQMAQLADRFQKTMEQLDKTSRRLKDINFVVEQKRLIDLKNQDSSNFYNLIDDSGLEENISRITLAEEARLDKLETVNINFGYDNETGHKKLLDTVNDAIDGLESIKKNHDLDTNKFHEYQELHANFDAMEKDRFSIDSLKSEFDIKFPNYSEKLLKYVADKLSTFIDNED